MSLRRIAPVVRLPLLYAILYMSKHISQGENRRKVGVPDFSVGRGVLTIDFSPGVYPI